MFRLVVTVKRGSTLTYPAAWSRYPALEEARAATAAVLREERAQRVMIVRDDGSGSFVEWLDR